MSPIKNIRLFLSIFVVGTFSSLAHADQVNVAVAANFVAPMKKISHDFERETGHQLRISTGSTGSFYAQIKNGAPFHVLLAADDETPLKIENEGLGVTGSRFTYAIGKLILWSKQTNFVDSKGEILKSNQFDRLAIANPKIAPYGLAAMEVLERLNLQVALKPKLVQGESIAQAYQFVATQNAQLGFVALSQVIADGKISEGSAWIIPATMYSPIRQDAVLLNEGKGSLAATAFLTYLRGEKARATIRSFGYEL